MQLRPKPIYKGNESFLQRFWNWPTFSEYVYVTLYFGLILAAVVYYSVQHQLVWIGQTMASVATVIEIGSAVPQILTIFINKSANGVSRGMVGIWLCSDSYKTIYFVMKDQPMQFILTGFFQAMLDLTLICQMVIYRNAGKQKETKTQTQALAGETAEQNQFTSSMKKSVVSEEINDSRDRMADFSPDCKKDKVE